MDGLLTDELLDEAASAVPRSRQEGWFRHRSKLFYRVAPERELTAVRRGWPLGRPLVGSLKNGLWEVRSSLPSKRMARLILCFHDQVLVVLHGFIKKTQKTPADDLALAKRRMKEVTK